MRAVRNLKEIEVTIILDGEEAKWLKTIVQNPIYGQSAENEDELDAKIRLTFWHILDREGV